MMMMVGVMRHSRASQSSHLVYFGAEVWRETSREETLDFSDPPFLDFGAQFARHVQVKGRTLGESQTFHLHDDQLHPPQRRVCVRCSRSQLPGHAQTPRLKLRDADVSFFLGNLLRIGENMKQQL